MTRRTALSLLACVPAARLVGSSANINMVYFELDGKVVAQYRVPLSSEIVVHDLGQYARFFSGWEP